MKKIIALIATLLAAFAAAALLLNTPENETLVLPTARAASTAAPTILSTVTPAETPTPSGTPPITPTASPTEALTSSPTAPPTVTPTALMTVPPTSVPTKAPTSAPTHALTLPAGTPDFTIKNAQGETKKLSDFLGRPIVLNFWASWCVPCKSELPAFQAAYDAYGSDVTFLLVSLDSTDRAAKEFMQNNGLTLPFWRDDNAEGRTAYGVTSIPQTFFLNARGEIVSKKIGALSQSALVNAIGQIRE